VDAPVSGVTCQGPPSTFLNVDGGLFRIYSSGTIQWVRRQYFLALIIDVTESPAPTPPKGPPSIFLIVDDERSRISIITCQGPTVKPF
jgi:hypothetical protein